MEKLDLVKKYKSYYSAKARPELVAVEKAQYLSITGKGDPDEVEFAHKIQALYSTAYTLKFIYKSRDRDFVVAKLEGLWWFDEKQFSAISMADAPKLIPRKEWEYRLLIRLPEFVEIQDVFSAIKEVVEKKEIKDASSVELYTMEGGSCIQILHVGPFSTEPESLELLNDFIKRNKFARNGLPHEIYLSDFRKTAPEKLKTILREPVKVG